MRRKIIERLGMAGIVVGFLLLGLLAQWLMGNPRGQCIDSARKAGKSADEAYWHCKPPPGM